MDTQLRTLERQFVAGSDEGQYQATLHRLAYGDDVNAALLLQEILIEQGEDGWFIAKVPDIQGCATQGKTVEQALQRVKEAIQVCLEAEEELEEPLKFIGIQQVEIKV